jgi:hypothetical protein
MAWGTEIWGDDTWAPEGNFSFELRGVAKGTAEDWSVDTVSSDERIGAFDETYGPGDSFWGSSIWGEDYYSTGLILWSWDPWEDFEEYWNLPHHVHSEPDTVNVVTAPDATVGDWPSQRALISDLWEQFKGHIQTTGYVHLSLDTDNFIPLSAPDDLVQAIGFTNLFSVLLYWDGFPGTGTNPIGHFTMWGLLGVHDKEDVLNRPTLGECYNEATMVALANHLKAKFNAHLATTSYGPTVEDARFAFENSDLEQMLVRDLRYENFERGWAIPDILPYTFDYPPFPERQERQIDMVTVDWGVGGGGGWGFTSPWPVTGWGNIKWGAGTPPSWKTGHEEFLGDLSDIMIEEAIPGGERFEHGWKLPGTSGTWYNERFVAEFWDITNEEWRFRNGRTLLGITENFESGWKDNEEGATRYWDGSEWRFLVTPIPPTRQLYASGMGQYEVTDHEEYGGIDTYGFMNFVIGGSRTTVYADPLPVQLGFSPDVCVKIVSGGGIVGSAIVQVNFVNADGDSDHCYIVLDGGEAAGDYLFDCFAMSPSLTATRSGFAERWGGMRQITSASVISGGTGTIGVRGYLGCKDTFEEEDWTLTLTI